MITNCCSTSGPSRAPPPSSAKRTPAAASFATISAFRSVAIQRATLSAMVGPTPSTAAISSSDACCNAATLPKCCASSAAPSAPT